MAKGAEYEREFCRLLSLWWTDGASDAAFWRTSNSGGRATVRGRKGKRTSGHYGDVGAVDADGQPLVDALTIECKRGYSKASLQDLLDAPRKAALQQWELWIRQAIEAHDRAGSYSWLLVVRRDRREPLVCFPGGVFKELEVNHMRLAPLVWLWANVRAAQQGLGESGLYLVTTLDAWFSYVSPADIRRLAGGKANAS